MDPGQTVQMALSNKDKIRLIAFDLDGTLVDDTVFIWSTLHQHLKTDSIRRQQAHDDYFNNKITYQQWFENDLQLFKEKGADKTSILEAVKLLKPAPGAHHVLKTLAEKGYKLAVISGSLQIVLDHFFSDILFDHVLINHIHFDEIGKISGGKPTPFDLEEKAQGLKKLARLEGLTLSECAFIGDNFNDVSVMQVAGFSVGINVKSEKVRAVADVIVESANLEELLPLFTGRDNKG